VSAAHRRRVLTASIALVAMWAFALMPTVSRAMAFLGGGMAWAEVCTTAGVERVSATDGAPAPGQAALHLDSCAFCSLASGSAAPPPALPSASVLPAGSAFAPRLSLLAPRTLHPWRSAQPRGPPCCA